MGSRVALGSSMSLEAKVAVVTGGASGIGRAISLAFASKGARVVVADRNLAGARSVVEAINAVPAEGIAVGVDVSNSSTVDQMVDEALFHFHHIDIVVHCAGICPRCDVLSMDDAEWRSVLGVNLDQEPARAAAIAGAAGIGYPVLIDEDKDVSRTYRADDLPLIVLIDRDGSIRARHQALDEREERGLLVNLRDLIDE